MTSSPRLQSTFPWFLSLGTFWSFKAGILDPMEVDLPQGKKACHCRVSCGISKMSCGQVLVSPVTQQQGLARQRYNNLLSSGRLLGPSRTACDLKDCLMAFSVRRVMCPQCLEQVQRGGAMWCAHMGPQRKPSALQAVTSQRQLSARRPAQAGLSVCALH